MNEMDLLSRMREEVPAAPVSARAQRAFFAGLQGTETPTRRHWAVRPGWRVAVAAGLCLALAAGAVTSLALRGQHTAAPGDHPSTSGAGGVTLTAQVLATRAARAAEAQPPVSPHQWFYVSTVYSGLGTRIHLTKPFVGWQTADNTKNASYQQGRLVVGLAPRFFMQPPYSALASMPRNPAALARYLGHYRPIPNPIYGHKPIPGSNVGWPTIALNQIDGLLSNYVMPPRFTAELYRALGDIPGVQVRQGLTSIEGQRGTGFILREDTDPSTITELILNPRTYAFMGDQTLERVHGVLEMSGTVMKWVRTGGPGVLP
jgi:hypothetical protein